MLGIIGLALTAIGTITAIVNPKIGAVWAGDDTARKERRLQARYYVGISMIVVGTIIQIIAALND